MSRSHLRDRLLVLHDSERQRLNLICVDDRSDQQPHGVFETQPSRQFGRH
jgi:hypothetical protein